MIKTTEKNSSTPKARRFRLAHLTALVALAMSTYHYTVGFLGEPIAQIHRPAHLAFVLGVVFLGALSSVPADVGSKRRRTWSKIVDAGLLVVSLGATGYLFLNAEAVSSRISFITPLNIFEYVLGIGLILVILEAARRTIGIVLSLITGLFLLYAVLGSYLPYPFWHRGYSLSRIIEQSYLGLDGIWGVPLGVTASYVFLFVLLGALLLSSGGGAFFTDLASRLTQRTVGGPAKGSIVASTFMGMLSGSSAANAVTTGAFTIPAMRRNGYSKEFAAGVEAASSANGQITPPIMGAAAFIMVEFTGIPYLDIMRYALIPAVLCFIAVFFMVDLEARRLNLASDPNVDGSTVWDVLKRKAYLLLPVILLVLFLYWGYTPATAAFWCITSLIASLLVFDSESRQRMGPILYEAFTTAPKLIATISIACAAAGIIVGVIHMTGIGLKISSIVLSISQGNLFLLLVLTMIVSVVLGMGMPTSAAYVILAALLAPGIVELGVPLIAAHMFVMFGASKSAITPPVAIASYAAAAVAGADPWKTSLIAFRLALAVFIVPYMFVFGPALLGIGTLGEVGFAILTATAGIFMLSVSVIGWFRFRLHPWQRVVALAAALTMINPGGWTDLLGIGLALLVFVTARPRKNTSEIRVSEGEY